MKENGKFYLSMRDVTSFILENMKVAQKDNRILSLAKPNETDLLLSAWSGVQSAVKNENKYKLNTDNLCKYTYSKNRNVLHIRF